MSSRSLTPSPSTIAAAASAAMAEDERHLKEEWMREMRGSIMVVAVLVGSVTYQAGLNPPGGFWQDDMSTLPSPSGSAPTYIRDTGHFAGDPILRDKNFYRYGTYLACNTVAFVQSMAIIVLLMFESSFKGRFRLYLLRVFVLLDVVAMGLAYSVGSTRDPYDVYFSALVYLVLIVFVTATSVAVSHHYKRKEHRRRVLAMSRHGRRGRERELDAEIVVGREEHASV